MDAERYVVFEIPQTSSDDAERLRDFGVDRGPLDRSLEADVHVEELTPDEVADARRKPGLEAARPMPMKLVRPVAVDEAQAPASHGASWGVEAVGALASPFTGDGVKVAVLDTGIDADHPAFEGVTVTQRDFTGEGDGDDDGHGTHCAGTIAGRSVNGYRIGVAPGVTEILAGKVLGREGGSTESVLRGMTWALEEGATVISMSLGFDFPGYVASLTAEREVPVEQATSLALEDYRNTLRLFGSLAAHIRASTVIGRPAIVVAATGNESRRGAGARSYTISISPPAASEGFIGVAALGLLPNGELDVARFSNTGAAVAAPGVDIVSARPGGGYVSASGTSMATPHVAGVAALWAESILAATGALDADELASRLLASGRRITSLSPNDIGAGLVQAPMG
jgi:subtilisin family serine protease